MSTDPDLEAALAAAGLAGAAPGTTVSGPLVIAGPDDLPDAPAPEGQVVLDDDNARLWESLARLPERCQRLLRIVAAESRPDYTVIARQLGMPVGSIGPTRGRCLEKLRRELVEAGATP